MARRMSLTEARKRLTELPAELRNGEVVKVTRGGKPVLAVLSWDLYETITETLEVAADIELRKQLKQSVAQLESGMVIPWEVARRELGE